jgi:polysaccharide export outer membrane protein
METNSRIFLAGCPGWRSSPGAPLIIFLGCWICALVLALMGVGSSIAWAQAATDRSQSATVPDQSAITIGPGDMFDLTVFDVPELVLKVRVDSSGGVSLPLLGDLKLAGMTVRDSQRLIARELVARQLVKDPQVSLFIEEFATQGITVYGEVNTPGVYPLMGPHRLYDAISMAGGLTMKAGRTVTILHAGQREHPEVITLSNESSIGHADVRVYPGDTIIVSKTGVVYVLGEVNKPGAFLLENNTSMSLLKATALAGGTTKVASLKNALILKESPQGPLETKVSLDKIAHAKAEDLQLHAEDILFVPLSNLKNYGTMGLQGAIQAAVYSVYAVEAH